MTMAEKSERRQGIALIIVLGMLSVMMVLGVAFVITMRTERVAAGNYMEVMKARHLVYTALARAMDDIEEDLEEWDTPHYPDWPTNYNFGPDFVKSVDLYTGDATELIPKPIFDLSSKLASPGQVHAVNASKDSIKDDNATWSNDEQLGLGVDRFWVERIVLPNGDRNNVRGRIDSIKGRWWLNTEISDDWSTNHLYRMALPQWREVEGGGKFAYLVLNLSGLLDANYVDNVARSVGTDPGEMQLANLSDIASEGNLATHRKNNAPYERTSDFVFGNSGLDGDPRNFCAYSRYPAAFTNIEPADISGDTTNLEKNETEIQDSLRQTVRQYYPTDGSLQNAAVDALFVNLYDYVDGDSVPGSFLNPSGITSGPYVEAVPMISEITLTNSFQANATDIIGGKSWVTVEYAYPFADSPPHAPFTMQYTVDYVEGIDCPPGLFSSPNIVNSKGPVSPSPADAYAKVGGSILQPSGIATVPNTTNFQFEVVVNAYMEDRDGNVVDRIPAITLPVSVVNLTAATPFANEVGADVIDPVYNWDQVHWKETALYPWSSSMGSINSATTNFFSKNGFLVDTNLSLHVRNGGVGSVGELGYLYFPGGAYANSTLFNLIYSSQGMRMDRAPWLWRTIRLYDRGDGTRWDRVLDYFAITNASVRHGLVNLNTQNLEPLSAVFNGMRKNDYPGDSFPGASLSWPDAQDLANAIQTVTETNQCLSLSDMGRRDIISSVFASTILNLANEDEVRKESFIRNSCGLLHTRQNLFAILLAGKSKIAVEQRALAIVWRDPLPTASGQHRSFIRWFTWLEK